MNDTLKVLDMAVSGVCFMWSGFTSYRLLTENKTNGLTMALTALFSMIGLACGWSMYVVWKVRERYDVIVPHLFGMVGLSVIMTWLNEEWESHE